MTVERCNVFSSGLSPPVPEQMDESRSSVPSLAAFTVLVEHVCFNWYCGWVFPWELNVGGRKNKCDRVKLFILRAGALRLLGGPQEIPCTVNKDPRVLHLAYLEI